MRVRGYCPFHYVYIELFSLRKLERQCTNFVVVLILSAFISKWSRDPVGSWFNSCSQSYAKWHFSIKNLKGPKTISLQFLLDRMSSVKASHTHFCKYIGEKWSKKCVTWETSSWVVPTERIISFYINEHSGWLGCDVPHTANTTNTHTCTYRSLMLTCFIVHTFLGLLSAQC